MLWNLGGFNPANLAPPMLNAAVNPGMTHPNLTSQMMLGGPGVGGLVPNNAVPVAPATAPAPMAAPVNPPVVSNAAAKGDMLQPAANATGQLFGNGRPREAGAMPDGAGVQGAAGGNILQRAGSALSGIRAPSGGEGQKIYSPRAPEPSQRIDQGQLLQLVMSQMRGNIPGLLGGR